MNRAEAAVIARAAAAAKRPPLNDRFWSKVDRRGPDECWPWTAAVRKAGEGYGAFWFKGRHHPAARIALLLSGVDVPEGMVACHRCDNPPCCNPAHLFVGTPRENNDDKVAKHRQAHGERHGNAVLSVEDVAEIRRLAALGAHQRRSTRRDKPYGYRAIAEIFGITEAHVGDIVRGDERRTG